MNNYIVYADFCRFPPIFSLCSAQRLCVLCGSAFRFVTKNHHVHLIMKMNFKYVSTNVLNFRLSNGNDGSWWIPILFSELSLQARRLGLVLIYQFILFVGFRFERLV